MRNPNRRPIWRRRVSQSSPTAKPQLLPLRTYESRNFDELDDALVHLTLDVVVRIDLSFVPYGLHSARDISPRCYQHVIPR